MIRSSQENNCFFVLNENTWMPTLNSEIASNSENNPLINGGNIDYFSFFINNENLPIFEPEKKEKKIINKAKNQNANEPYTPSNDQNKNISIRKIKFAIKKINPKRGRVSMRCIRKQSSKTHDRNTIDNLLRKVQVHYLTFIIKFLNNVLMALNKKKKFKRLDYKYKMNINKTFVNSLKITNIGDIIKNSKISKKFKKTDKDYNKNLFEEYKEDKILGEIFKEQYLMLFRKIYFKNKKKINMKELGLDIDREISLSNVKMYEDLLKDKNANNDEEYRSNLNKCIIQHFFSKTHFEIK